MKIVAQDGTPLPAEHLISSVNLQVEVRGTEVGDTFRLLAMRKLESLPLL
jgi:hypothetical protein